MKISEVSKKFNISTDTLRYYEKIGLIPSVNRNNGGIREYTEEDCNWIEFILCMKNAGLSIKTLVKYVDLFQQGDDTIEERKELLINEREKLRIKIENMKKTLERLDFKIAKYEEKILKKEETLKSLQF
ncbi:MerR family transcriptional regulator [Petrotoga sp. 9PWA.NaAc.5.4]|uniref:MerR family transcriptional regulator n=1 Tax=Petrotoga sp. 9PWA.NaAc.5.4 TaxID=1434328 RepID=UPI000CAB97AB|nr:MerR family transcriptional regulator [Petrotoga sp. 9PWA.NaAc.5.4]PNR93702.1 transcriptional regulator [Petrotoga sp. 9PWA.NaAc.5.4]